MLGECHAHVIMDGFNYKEAIALHKNGVEEAVIHQCFAKYKDAGSLFIRDGGDSLGVSKRAKEIAPEYGITYLTPVFAIHKKGHYGGIVGRSFSDEKEYLVLLQTNHCWSFPKGHMEKGESEQQTALRELYEETGLCPIQITDDRLVLEYDIPPFTRKQVILFLCEVEGSVVPQQSEILRHCWVTAEDLKEYLLADTYEARRPLLR